MNNNGPVTYISFLLTALLHYSDVMVFLVYAKPSDQDLLMKDYEIMASIIPRTKTFYL